MNELTRVLAARAAGQMSDAELAEMGRGLPDVELAAIVRQALGAPPASVFPPSKRVERKANDARISRLAQPSPVQVAELAMAKVSGRHLDCPIQDAVLEVLRTHPDGLTFTGIQKLCNGNKGSVYAACEALRKAGKVAKIGNGQGATWKLA